LRTAPARRSTRATLMTRGEFTTMDTLWSESDPMSAPTSSTAVDAAGIIRRALTGAAVWPR